MFWRRIFRANLGAVFVSRLGYFQGGWYLRTGADDDEVDGFHLEVLCLVCSFYLRM